MGSVYLAEDRAIGQQVAIKVVHAEDVVISDPNSTLRALDRFRQEARAVASLDHIYILPLYRFGEEETSQAARAYMVMQYRPEGSLWDWLRRRANTAASNQGLDTVAGLAPSTMGPKTWPLGLDEAGEYLRQAASALQYAHERGIVHRDIKPANFLIRLDEGKSVHLLLSDFGLAKFFTSPSTTTTILGTPTYMAPEQFEGAAVPESDQYALAIMIYQFLAGQPPFSGETLRLMHQHLTAVPTPLRFYAPDVPQGVEVAILRALAKKPAERYPSIAQFAQDFAQGARRAERTFAPLFTMPTLQNASAGTFTARPPVAGEDATQLKISSQQQTPVGSGGWQPGSTPAASLYHPWSSQVSPSAQTVQMGGQGVAGQVAGGLPPATLASQVQWGQPGAKHVSRRRALGWLCGGLAAVAVSVGGVTAGYFYVTRRELPPHALHRLSGHMDRVTSVGWSPDGTRVVSGSFDGTARLWEVTNEQSALTYTGHSGHVLAVAWRAGGYLLASGGDDRTVQVWDTSGKRQKMFSDLGAPVSTLAWVPGADSLFAGTSGAGMRELVLSDGRVRGKALAMTVPAVAVSRDGGYLAVGLGSGDIALINLQTTPHSTVMLSGHTQAVLALAWSLDGSKLVSGSADRTARVWDVASSQTVHLLPHQGAVNGVAWEPLKVARVATASEDGNVSLWDIDSSARTIYQGHAGPVTSIAWGAGGLASGSADTTIIIWQA